jgi:molybdenum-dependent DNA-binding transcriptional regulator ModE
MTQPNAPHPASPISGLPRIHPLHPRRWTPLRIMAFLTALDATGSVEAAAKLAGMSRQSAYKLRERQPDLVEAWRMAERTGRGFAPPAPAPDTG